MSETTADRLRALGIALPAPAAAAANYIPVQRSGNLVIVSGQLPMEAGTVRYKGKLGGGVTLEDGQAAARLCAINILAQVKAACGDLDRVAACLRLGGFVACTPEFADHPEGDQRRLRPDGRGPGRGRAAMPALRSACPACRSMLRSRSRRCSRSLSRCARRLRRPPGPHVTSIAGVEAAAWDGWSRRPPFLSHAFLNAMEASGSACEETGWLPFHLVVEEAGPAVAAPRSTSRAIPTASTCSTMAGRGLSPRRRALLPEAAGRRCRSRRCRGRGCWRRVPAPRGPDRSLVGGHPPARPVLAARELLHAGRSGMHWRGRLSPAPRHPVPLGQPGLSRFSGLARGAQEHQAQDGAQGARAGPCRRRHSRGGAWRGAASRALEEFFPFYLATVDKRWGNAYLSRDFFRRLGATCADRIVLVVARHEGQMVGGRPQPARRRTRSTAGSGAAWRSSSSSTSRPATIRRSSSPSATGCSGSRPARKGSTSCIAATPRSGPTAPT